MARLIRSYQQGNELKPRGYRRHRFPQRYTGAVILAVVDEAHETLRSPATQKILLRELYEFHDACCQRLAQLSVAQLYRLRKRPAYRHRRVAHQPTRPRRWPSENGVSPTRKGGPDTWVWTRYIKAIGIE